jgi:site-specific DNA recombinase
VRGDVAALYIRVSSREQAEEGNSPAFQRRLLRDYSDRHEYNVRYIFEDLAERGGDMHRPQFLRMLRAARDGRFKVLVVWKMDRLARNAAGAMLVERRLRAYGVRLEGIQMGPQEDNPMTRFIRGQLHLLSELDNDLRVEQTREGRRECALRGEWPRRAPFGYTKVNGRPVIEPTEAAVVREAYAECIRGANRLRLAALLGLEPTTAIRRIQNPMYKGEGKYGDIRVPFPAIVDAETWQAAQDAIRFRKLNPPGGPGPYSKREQEREARAARRAQRQAEADD